MVQDFSSYCRLNRLGAMVVMEEITEENQDLAAEVLEPLRNRFHQVPAQIQGDILHVFGETGDSRSVSWLESVLSGDFDREVKEAAEEALEKVSGPDTQPEQAGIEYLLYRSPRRRRYNPYESEASLCLFNISRQHSSPSRRIYEPEAKILICPWHKSCANMM